MEVLKKQCRIAEDDSPESFADRLAAYPVISFDVFDTLVFRPFSDPTDLFRMIGKQIGRPNFRRIRRRAELASRKEKHRREGYYEVTLEEIYQRLEKKIDIDRKQTQRLEVELEEQICFANPYMLRIVEILRERGRRLIVASDMYLPEEVIKEILRRCGYPEFDAYYISAEIKKSKSRGDLYAHIRAEEQRIMNEKKLRESFFENMHNSGFGKDQKPSQFVLRLVHVGDNEQADVINAEKNGFAAIHYKKAN